ATTSAHTAAKKERPANDEVMQPSGTLQCIAQRRRMYRFPDLPDVPESARAEGPMSLRYEDVAQDGRLMLQALPHGLGEVMWAKTLSKAGLAGHLYQHGIVPILTRFVFEGLGGPIAVRRPLFGQGGYWLAHTTTAGAQGGAVDR